MKIPKNFRQTTPFLLLQYELLYSIIIFQRVDKHGCSVVFITEKIMDNTKENEQNTELDVQPEETDFVEDNAEETAEIAEVTCETDLEPQPRLRSAARIGIICASALLAAILLLGGCLLMVLYGPSSTAGEEAVVGMRANALGRGFLSLAMSDDDIAVYEADKAARELVESTELGVLSVSINQNVQNEQETPETEENDKTSEENDTLLLPDEDDGIELVHIKSDSYQGTMLIIDDPTRIFVGVPDRYGESAYGLTLRDMIRKYDAVGGINAGGFEVIGDIQKGGVPMGFVIKDSKLAWGDGTLSKNICGFDANGKLVVGTMTPNQAIARGVVDAVSFGPALLVDGKPMNTAHWLGVERNARTAIGQREDGTILLLVIEGRHIASFGAYFTEVIDIFLEYGAVNATNLDGGYSTFMVYEDGGLDMHSYAYGERYLPTSILIKKK